MSRGAHRQSTYKLRSLPRCSKCKEEFQLVTAVYEEDGKYIIVEEWECPNTRSCGKIVPKNVLKEQPMSAQDKRLSDWCKNERKREERRRKHTSSQKTN